MWFQVIAIVVWALSVAWVSWGWYGARRQCKALLAKAYEDAKTRRVETQGWYRTYPKEMSDLEVLTQRVEELRKQSVSFEDYLRRGFASAQGQEYQHLVKQRDILVPQIRGMMDVLNAHADLITKLSTPCNLRENMLPTDKDLS